MKKLKSFLRKYKDAMFFGIDVFLGLYGFLGAVLSVALDSELSSSLMAMNFSMEWPPEWNVMFWFGVSGFSLVLAFCALPFMISCIIDVNKKSRGADNG